MINPACSNCDDSQGESNIDEPDKILEISKENFHKHFIHFLEDFTEDDTTAPKYQKVATEMKPKKQNMFILTWKIFLSLTIALKLVREYTL